jgi:hypothetical protein
MIPSRTRVEVGSILTPQDEQRLRQACPGLEDWPRRWHYAPADLEVGQRIVSALTPFLLHLLDQGLAKKTVSRHRDNLWLLGGELVKRRYDDKKLARMDVNDALLQLIDGEGGPLMVPSITETEQDSADATCRKLYRFIRDSAPAGKTTN